MIPVARICLLFVAFYQGKTQTKKSVILSHFSKVKFLFITADVLNSACCDSVSFYEKFEINFKLVSSGPPVLTNFHLPKWLVKHKNH